MLTVLWFYQRSLGRLLKSKSSHKSNSVDAPIRRKCYSPGKFQVSVLYCLSSVRESESTTIWHIEGDHSQQPVV